MSQASPQEAQKTQDELDFEEVELAVRSTPRGRWFLEEFARRNRAADTQQILEAIDSLKLAAGDHRTTVEKDVLYRELEEMSASIERARNEIAQLRPAGQGDNKIMAATEELDAIVSATERATTDILSSAERLQETSFTLRDSGAPDALCDNLDREIMEIFTACSFQDITGQRTTKVVNVLRYLEQRIHTMISVWGNGANVVAGGVSTTRGGTGAQGLVDTRPDAHLLNGPAKEGEGVSQSAVDDLFGDGADPAAEAPLEQMADAQASDAAANAEPTGDEFEPHGDVDIVDSAVAADDADLAVAADETPAPDAANAFDAVRDEIEAQFSGAETAEASEIEVEQQGDDLPRAGADREIVDLDAEFSGNGPRTEAARVAEASQTDAEDDEDDDADVSTYSTADIDALFS